VITEDARKLGVRTDDLLLAQPDCGEQELDIVEMLVKWRRRESNLPGG